MRRRRIRACGSSLVAFMFFDLSHFIRCIA
jgi:hypothetical protein